MQFYQNLILWCITAKVSINLCSVLSGAWWKRSLYHPGGEESLVRVLEMKTQLSLLSLRALGQSAWLFIPNWYMKLFEEKSEVKAKGLVLCWWFFFKLKRTLKQTNKTAIRDVWGSGLNLQDAFIVHTPHCDRQRSDCCWYTSCVWGQEGTQTALLFSFCSIFQPGLSTDPPCSAFL